MQIDQHDLPHEFPEYKERIHELKLKDHRFAKLYDEYDALTTEIRRLEMDGLRISDYEMEQLKLNRIRLKDKLYAYLRAQE